jgi:hypothetical protein
VLLLAVSWIYDFTWFFLLDQSAADEDLEDGGNEWKIRRFVKLVTFITILFKIIVVALFWKVSLEFRAIVRNKGQGSAQEDDIDFIVSQYQGAEQFIQ